MYNLRLICIVDGWTQDNLTYNSTEPIRQATIDLLSKQCPFYDKTFNNNGFDIVWQPVRVSCDTSQVRLYLNSVYGAGSKAPMCVPPPPGTKAAGCRELTGISDIRFYYSPVPISLIIPWNAATKQ